MAAVVAAEVDLVARSHAKLTDEKPYECPLLGLTPADVAVFQKAVPDQVKAHFDPKRTFCKQKASVKAKATLALERLVPALALAENHWAALCLLSKSHHNIQANNDRQERRQELRRAAVDKRLAELRAAADKNLESEGASAAIEDLAFWLRHKRGRD